MTKNTSHVVITKELCEGQKEYIPAAVIVFVLTRLHFKGTGEEETRTYKVTNKLTAVVLLLILS